MRMESWEQESLSSEIDLLMWILLFLVVWEAERLYFLSFL